MVVGSMEQAGLESWADTVQDQEFLELGQFFEIYCQTHPAAQLAEMQALLQREWRVLSLPDGRRYDGLVLDGRPHERGSEIDSLGRYYVGTYNAAGLPEGVGTLAYSDNRRYMGEIAAPGQPTGMGVWFELDAAHPTGEKTIESEFVNASICRLTYNDGRQYEGEVLAGQPHGVGTEIVPGEAGSQYKGEWVHGKFDGQGSIVNADGSRYDGLFVAGERHGQGHYQFGDGGSYHGEWYMGQPHGNGAWTYADGGRYEGAFVAGERHGTGVMVEADGTVSRGPWVQDEFRGTVEAAPGLADSDASDLPLEQKIRVVKALCTWMHWRKLCLFFVHSKLFGSFVHAVFILLPSDYDSSSKQAQSASSFDLALLWRVMVKNQRQQQMTELEFLSFFRIMGTSLLFFRFVA